MQKMGTEHSRPKENSKPEVKILHKIDIACIGAEACTRHLKNPSSETFVASLTALSTTSGSGGLLMTSICKR